MNVFSNPYWIDDSVYKAETLDEISTGQLESIRESLKRRISAQPVVSVIIAAWNEEVNIIKCLHSISKSETRIPFEVIVINNNSTDRTQEILDKLGVTSYIQAIQGVGPSRALGQQKAKGKYILSADADCIYPTRWIDIMTNELMKKNVVFVYGRFSYIADKTHPRWQLFIFESFRNLLSEIRNINRPYLNSYGISLGYIRELGLQEGYIDKNIRGFDGRLCFDMMKYGKVQLIRSSHAKAWTGTRALDRDGSFFRAILKRVLREIARVEDYFTKAKPHDTKTSQNRDYSVKNSIESIKRKYNPFRFFRK